MADLLEILLYPIKQFALLLFSLQIGTVSVGALIVSAIVLQMVFRIFIGQHLSSVFASGIVQRSGSRSKKGEKDA